MAPSAGMNGALALRQARRALRPAGGRVDEALAVAMQPHHLASERDRLVEQRLVRRQRNAQARSDEIGAKASGEGRMRHDRGDIGEEILGADRRALGLGQRLQHVRAHVRLRRLRIGPERIDPAAERAFVVMLVWHEARDGYSRTGSRRMRVERRSRKSVCLEQRIPKPRPWIIQHPRVADHPLAIETFGIHIGSGWDMARSHS